MGSIGAGLGLPARPSPQTDVTRSSGHQTQGGPQAAGQAAQRRGSGAAEASNNASTTAAAAASSSSPTTTHQKNSRDRNEREQVRAKKITQLITELRVNMQRGGWKEEMKSKYQTLSQ